MCHQAKNIEKFGVANPDRKQRHVLCKKQIDNEESDQNTSIENSSGEDKRNVQVNDKKVCIKLF